MRPKSPLIEKKKDQNDLHESTEFDLIKVKSRRITCDCLTALKNSH
jgi:hypothetical protein